MSSATIPKAAAMHKSSAKPRVATAKDTRSYDDYDNSNDDEEANSKASPFERFIGISTKGTYIPIQCRCNCRLLIRVISVIKVHEVYNEFTR